MGAKKIADLGGTDRAAEQVALAGATAEVDELLPLLLGFYAFGNDVQVQVVGQRENRLDDAGVDGLGNGVDELLVDLQDVDRQLLQLDSEE